MSNYTAADVKKLREETDAPMMECKAALEEAGGDFEKAKLVLREKGKAAAAKRADRSTAAGVVAFSSSPDGKTVGGIVLESETDFVAKNPDFIEIANQIADLVRDGAEATDPRIQELVEGAVAKIRENIKVAKAVRLTNDFPVGLYVHHDKTKGAAILLDADAAEAARQLAIHTVAFPPEVISKDELSQEKLAAELEVEIQRAINEGKNEQVARNVAQGRVNKEFVKRAVLLEQPYYTDQTKSVSQVLAETAKGASIKAFAYLAVGQS